MGKLKNNHFLAIGPALGLMLGPLVGKILFGRPAIGLIMGPILGLLIGLILALFFKDTKNKP